ncbi:MAG: hypothetical protein JWP74_522 [Marmoricola sp.]|nr:hypothetical protein [Marmoricola sp.]
MSPVCIPPLACQYVVVHVHMSPTPVHVSTGHLWVTVLAAVATSASAFFALLGVHAARKSAETGKAALENTLAIQEQARESQRKTATIDYWRNTYGDRVRLRAALGYEHGVSFTERVRKLTEFYQGNSLREIPPRRRPLNRDDRNLREYLSIFETLGAGVCEDAFDLEVLYGLDGPRIIALGECVDDYLKARRPHVRELQEATFYGYFAKLVARLRAHAAARATTGS